MNKFIGCLLSGFFFLLAMSVMMCGALTYQFTKLTILMTAYSPELSAPFGGEPTIPPPEMCPPSCSWFDMVVWGLALAGGLVIWMLVTLFIWKRTFKTTTE